MLTNFFGKSQQQAEPATAPQQPETPTEAAPESSVDTPANPLDAYAGLWDNQQSDADTMPTLNIPDDAISEVVKGLDFMAGIDPSLIQQAKDGNTESLLGLIQASNANAYRLAMQHSATVVNDHTNRVADFTNKQLPGSVKSTLTDQALSDSTPNFSNPTVKAEFNRVANQIQAKNPNASPSWIAEQTKSYFATLAGATSNPTQPTASQSESVDWTEYVQG